MTKDQAAESEAPSKKKVKIESPPAVAEDEFFPNAKKLDIANIFPVICEFYDELASSREEEDWAEYKKACSCITNAMADIIKLKTDKPEGWEEKIALKRREVPLAIILMKKLNRCEKLRIRAAREDALEKKQEVETTYLNLQNTLAEIENVSVEVDRCLELRNMNFGIELVSLDEFYREAPKSISKPEVTKIDDHKRQLARLEWELKQRKDKAALCDDLENNRKKVVSEIKKRETTLESLKPLVNDVINAAKPLSTKLNVNVQEPAKKHHLASLLHDRLYFLFVQADAYREACDKKMLINISGNVEAAKKFKEEPFNIDSKDLSLSLEEKRKKLMMKHPLFVKIKVVLKDRNSITLNFYYLVNLGIISVAPRITLTSPINSSAAHPLLRDRTILNDLFPNDHGNTSPNPSNYYQLKKVGLDKIDIEEAGLVYGWVQKLGGMEFLKPGGDRSIQLTQATIPVVIKNIRNRLTARLTLASQLISFESGNVTIPASMAGIKLTAALKTWIPITYQEFARRLFTRFIIQAGSICPDDFYYRAIIKKPPAIIEVLVVVKANYPNSQPVFIFQLLLEKQKLNSRNNTHIRDLEREVNVYWEELVAKNRSPLYLLSALLHRALVSIEILLSSLYPETFPDSSKTLLQPVSGRTRSLPFKYAPVGEGLFVPR